MKNLLQQLQARLQVPEGAKRLGIPLIRLVLHYLYGPAITACATAAGLALYREEPGEALRWLLLAGIVEGAGPTLLAVMDRSLLPPPPAPREEEEGG